MRIIVQKFGGTSVCNATMRARVVERVLAARARGLSPVVVASAMGRNGDPYATDTLLSLLESTGAPADPRERDQLIACGEIISCALLAQTLNAHGCPAVSLTGGQAGIITDDHFGDARIVEVRTEVLLGHLKEGRVPVVAGFQGVNRRGEVTTLGRGGSDTTAAALASALNAEVVEIYTDVDGIMTADPRLVPEAGILPHLTYHEVAELAHMGAKVIHPRAVELARLGRVPMRVLNTAGNGQGTLIADGFSAPAEQRWSDRVVTGIAHVPGQAQVQVEGTGDFCRDGTGLRLFRRLADARISLDMIYVSPTLLLFIVDQGAKDGVEAVLKELGLTYRIRDRFAKVSVVGAGMHGVPGVMAEVLAALHSSGTPVFQTTDSHASISCLVRESDVARAVRALHERFGLGRRGQSTAAASAAGGPDSRDNAM